eukprot:gene12267-15413_t
MGAEKVGTCRASMWGLIRWVCILGAEKVGAVKLVVGAEWKWGAVELVVGAEKVGAVELVVGAEKVGAVKLVVRAEKVGAVDLVVGAEKVGAVKLVVGAEKVGAVELVVGAEKVALAQKWMVTKANVAARPVVVSAHMLESMVDKPIPTRAEMTDVANALYDGCDAVMLRFETGNGKYPSKAVSTAASHPKRAVSTAAAILKGAQVGIDHYAQFNFIRNYTPKPMGALEAVSTAAAILKGAQAVSTAAAILKGAQVGIDHYAQFNFIRNYTPKPMAALESVACSAIKASIDMGAQLICVITNSVTPIRALAKYRPPQSIVVATTNAKVANQANIYYGAIPLLLPREQGLADFVAGDEQSDQLIIMSGPAERLFVTEEDLAETEFVTIIVGGGDEAADLVVQTGYVGESTIAYRSTKVGLDLICDPITSPRKTKLLCTLGPACWSEEGLSKLIDAGMNVARFNFSHGTHASHQEVLDRLRKVAADKGCHIAVLLDTKGPEIRTAMLRNHQPIELVAGQEVTVVSVGSAYVEWEGFKDEQSGETKIGLSYDCLCTDLKPGMRILIADGQIILQVLDHAGGKRVQIISKIESSHGLTNYDAILRESDGIMVARGDLAMEIPSEKLAPGQEMLIPRPNITQQWPGPQKSADHPKANIMASLHQGNQMLESMCRNPLPTRAEIVLAWV